MPDKPPAIPPASDPGPSPDGPRGHAAWGPWMAFAGTVLALALGLLFALPVMAIDGNPDNPGTVAGIAMQAFTAAGFLAAPFLIAWQVPPVGLSAAAQRLGFVSFRPWSAVKWISISLVGYIAFAVGWSVVFGEPRQKDIAGDLGPLWTQILLIVVLAPISEEVCFRGFLFGGLRTRWSFPVAAIAAGLVFGLLHYSTGWSTVPQLAVLGAVFALVYEKTGSLWPPIIFHALNNAIVLATLN